MTETILPRFWQNGSTFSSLFFPRAFKFLLTPLIILPIYITSKIFHILLWDEFRSENALNPGGFNCSNRYSIVIPWGLGKNGNAPGSSLRAIGLISAFTEYVTFADDDVTWEYNHAETMLKSIENLNWTSCFRKIYNFMFIIIQMMIFSLIRFIYF